MIKLCSVSKQCIDGYVILAEWLNGDTSVKQAEQTRGIQSPLHSLLTTGTHFTEQWPGFPQLASTQRPKSRFKCFLGLHKHHDMNTTWICENITLFSCLICSLKLENIKDEPWLMPKNNDYKHLLFSNFSRGCMCVNHWSQFAAQYSNSAMKAEDCSNQPHWGSAPPTRLRFPK